MGTVEGRGIKEPILDVLFIGSDVILRVDDFRRSDFWLQIRLSPAEFGQLLARYERALLAAGNMDGLRRLMEGKV